MAADAAKPGPSAASARQRGRTSYAESLTARNVRQIARIQEEHQARSTLGERIATVIGWFSGSMWFVWIHIAWFGAWLAWNGIPMTDHPFDPAPFQELTLIVSLEAIFLSSFILISQNRETRLAERRNHLDLQINLLAEQESTQTLRLLHAICERLRIPIDALDLEHLEEEVDPQALAELIAEDIEK